MASLKKVESSVTTDDLAKQMEVLREDLSSLTRTIADFGKAKGDEAVATAKLRAEEAGQKLSGHADTARLKAMDAQDQANEFIRTQPATALGVAAAFGFLIGFLGSRK